MLSWDEEVTPTASQPPASSRSDELMAARFPAPNAMPTGAPSSNPKPPFACLAKALGGVTATNITRRLNSADKRIISDKTGVHQLVPFKYKWAGERYLSSCANHWMSQEFNMSRDIAMWQDPNGLTEEDRS